MSSGKSSLLNYLLETDVLPSGVTPVTAVPIRIVPGTNPHAVVSFATGKPENILASELAQYASEDRIPGNVQHVTDILLALPARRLSEGICFVDTPGLGSLAMAGAAQTFAFLPRCDLGVFLLDAASSLTETDIAAMRTIIENGAEIRVVLSKADLLTTDDRRKMLVYLRGQLAAALSREIVATPISIAQEHTSLTDAWFDAVLGPLQNKHKELAAVALRRKAGALKEAVVLAIGRRKNPLDARTDLQEVASFGSIRALIERNRRALYDIAFQKAPRTGDVLVVAADLAVQEAPTDEAALLKEAIATTLGRFAAEFGDAFTELLRKTFSTAESAIQRATHSSQGVALPEPFSRPLFDPAPLLAEAKLSLGWQRWPTAVARRTALRRQLQAKYSAELEEAFRTYAHALVGWGQHYLDDLAAQFNARANIIEANANRPVNETWSAELAHDFELLKNWNTEATVS